MPPSVGVLGAPWGEGVLLSLGLLGGGFCPLWGSLGGGWVLPSLGLLGCGVLLSLCASLLKRALEDHSTPRCKFRKVKGCVDQPTRALSGRLSMVFSDLGAGVGEVISKTSFYRNAKRDVPQSPDLEMIGFM